MRWAIVVPWHNPKQYERFQEAWHIPLNDHWLIAQHDTNKEGCARTKNKGIHRALETGAEVIIVLDDDCLPVDGMGLEEFAEAHLEALEPQAVPLYEPITEPSSRGTPYYNQDIVLSVAASMGYWENDYDVDAATDLVNKFVHPMLFKREPMFWRFFPFSGMNCAFRAEFWPFFAFQENVGRYDDIFMGYRLQAEAYRRKHCINLSGPIIRHERQSNVWANLAAEAPFMEEAETEWQKYV